MTLTKGEFSEDTIIDIMLSNNIDVKNVYTSYQKN